MTHKDKLTMAKNWSRDGKNLFQSVGWIKRSRAILAREIARIKH